MAFSTKLLTSLIYYYCVGDESCNFWAGTGLTVTHLKDVTGSVVHMFKIWLAFSKSRKTRLWTVPAFNGPKDSGYYLSGIIVLRYYPYYFFQLVSIVSALLVLIVLVALGKYLEPLPRAVLGSVIMVSLLTMLNQLTEIYRLWKISLIDAVSFARSTTLPLMSRKVSKKSFSFSNPKIRR